jgi:hypothetical protein
MKHELRRATHPGFRDGHIDCGCWITGRFYQVPCPWHDGKDKFPIGAYAASLERK